MKEKDRNDKSFECDTLSSKRHRSEVGVHR
jgi:hypothetical protein